MTSCAPKNCVTDEQAPRNTNLPRLNQKEIENVEKPIMAKELESVIKTS